MMFRNHLRPIGRVAAVGVAIAMLAATSPAWAHDDDSDDAGKQDKEYGVNRWQAGDDEDGDVRVYQWNEKEDGDDDGDVRIVRRHFQKADAKGGFLGVQVQNVTRALRRARDLTTDKGALVNHVEEDGPADDAGVKRGDVIIELDRQKLDDSSELIELLRERKPGTKVDIVVLRDGLRKNFTVKLGKRPRNSFMFIPGRDHEEMGPMIERMFENRSELHSDMDQLRQDLKELKEELRELRRELREARRGR